MALDLGVPPEAQAYGKKVLTARQKEVALIAESLKALKDWSEWQKSELRMTHKCTPEEANLYVKEAIVKWGHSLGRDIDFDRHLVWDKV